MERERNNWWRRLTRRVRGTSGAEPGELPAAGDDGLLVEPAEPDRESDDKGQGGLTRWAKRESALTQLQEGYERVNRLMADMQQHMADQSNRTERMCAAVEQLVRTMSDLPSLSRDQVRTLESIAGQIEAANTTSRQLADALAEIPKVTRAQADALSGINSRLEVMNEQSLVEAQVTEKLQAAVTRVGNTGQLHTELLKQLDTRAQEQNERLADLLANQVRRFTVLFVVVTVLAAVGVAAAVLALWRH